MSEKTPLSADKFGIQSLRDEECQAFAAFKKDADSGDGGAAYQVARLLFSGVGCQADLAESARYAQKAAEANNPDGLVFAAMLKLRETIISDSCAEVVDLLEKAARLGSSRAYLVLGQMYTYGVGVTKDVGKGMEYTCLAAGMGSDLADCLLMQGADAFGWPLDPAARRDMLDALRTVCPPCDAASGDAPEKSGATAPYAPASAEGVRSLSQALEKFLPDSPQRDFVAAATALLGEVPAEKRAEQVAKIAAAAEAGVPGAATFLAMMILNGGSEVGNEDQAARYIRADAELGWPQAQYLYSKMLDCGQNGEANPAEAFLYCQKAAEAGYTDACFALGQMYRLGHNVSQNLEQAVLYLRQAANFGHPSAMYVLAFMYFHGEGMPAEVNRCVALLKRAAGLGHVEAMFSLSEFFKGDLGYPADAEASLQWLTKAAEHGHKQAAAELEALFNGLE